MPMGQLMINDVTLQAEHTAYQAANREYVTNWSRCIEHAGAIKEGKDHSHAQGRRDASRGEIIIIKNEHKPPGQADQSPPVNNKLSLIYLLWCVSTGETLALIRLSAQAGYSDVKILWWCFACSLWQIARKHFHSMLIELKFAYLKNGQLPPTEADGMQSGPQISTKRKVDKRKRDMCSPTKK